MLKLYNTLSRKLETFEPINPDLITFYSCGPTVYDHAHIGNLRAYIFADILKRVLIFNGYEVKHVMNITDVGHLTSDSDEGEDKIEKSARLESKSAWDIAEGYMDEFKQDIKKLNILEPNIWARATEHIQEQIDLIKKLDQKGCIYKISDGMYFDTSKSNDYGKLARLNLEGQEEGARVEINTEKKNPTDFAVWKFSKPSEKRQMEWDSPWGTGFPGWHIECSAMSMKYLGETIDIHTGGIDHIPVHHTNEIAQSESATGKKFVNYWLHNDYLLVDNGKMSKSAGNFYTLQDLQDKGYEPMVYRFFNLTAQYRSKLNFTWESMDSAKNSWNKLKQKFFDLGQQTGEVDEKFIEKFINVINDDLNMPQALAIMWDVFKSDLPDYDKRATILEFDKIFGFGLAELQEEEDEKAPQEIIDLANEREKARTEKRFDKADEIRDLIEKMGWEVEDKAEGYELKKK